MEDPVVLGDNGFETLDLIPDAGDDQHGPLLQVVVQFLLVVVLGMGHLFNWFWLCRLLSGVVVVLFVDPADTAVSGVLKAVTTVVVA